MEKLSSSIADVTIEIISSSQKQAFTTKLSEVYITASTSYHFTVLLWNNCYCKCKLDICCTDPCKLKIETKFKGNFQTVVRGEHFKTGLYLVGSTYTF